MAGVLFEDIFDVKDIDPEGKKFDRVPAEIAFLQRSLSPSRLRADLALVVDVDGVDRLTVVSPRVSVAAALRE
ncbi:hypothetical protein LSAT2_027412 [Lamellibrachia satsuma]|nr:hypothetical protein LSAT2_027412 [Lamellibrachia satsuma]